MAPLLATRFVTPAPPYRLVRSRSTASDFHSRSVSEPADREIWHHDITAPAVVLGSTQQQSIVDVDACRRAGVEVVRRRSGGGAVLLLPGDVTWIDVIVPVGAPGWSDDVHGPMVWLGRHLAAAIADVAGVEDLAVHDMAMISTSWSKLVCFDGVGAGEVLVGGRKLVGLSQRRTRHAARLQCCWYSSYDTSLLVDLLSPSDRPLPDDLAPIATLTASTSDAIIANLADRLA